MEGEPEEEWSRGTAKRWSRRLRSGTTYHAPAWCGEATEAADEEDMALFVGIGRRGRRRRRRTARKAGWWWWSVSAAAVAQRKHDVTTAMPRPSIVI
jgi:hypothetical protein